MKLTHFRSLLTLTVIVFFISALNCGVQSTYPGKTWQKTDKPEKLGYSAEKLKAAKDFTKGVKTDVWGNFVTPGDVGRLIKMIFDAKIK